MRSTIMTVTITALFCAATERFKDVAQAIAAGYAPLLGCVSGPQQGAVEYVVVTAAWHAHTPAPPVLAGQLLHVWAWKENPNGAFVDWNPNVSCEGFTRQLTEAAR